MLHAFSYILPRRALLPLLALLAAPAAAQDVVFNHVLAAPQYTNPALAGTLGLYHAGAAVRSQFTALGAVHSSMYVEVDTYDIPWSRGVGLFVMNDRSSGGVFQTTAIGLSYSYAFRVSPEIELRPALQAVYYLQQRSPQELVFPDLVGSGGSADPSLYRETGRQRVDFAAGLVVQHPVLQWGIAAQHFGAVVADNGVPAYGDYALKVTTHAQAGIPLTGSGTIPELHEWAVLEEVVLLPQAKYVYQGGFQYLIANLSVRAGGLFAGMALKTPLAAQTYIAAATVGLMSQSLRIGYSFDVMASGGDLRGWDSGSHELFVHYSFGSSESAQRRRMQRYSRRYLNPLCGCPY